MTNYKFLFPIILLLLAPGAAFPQQGICNSWEGFLEIGSGSQLKIIFNISEDENGRLKALLDSPDQGAFGIPAGEVKLESEKLVITVPSINGVYEGTTMNNFSAIKGEWKQNGQSLHLALTPVKKINNDIGFLSIWQGKLKINEMELRVNLKFYRNDNDSTGAFLDSPDQSAMNIPASKVYFGEDSVCVEIKSINGTYSGKFNNDKSELEGKWIQHGTSFNLTLNRTKKIEEIKRPQEPKRPFPYNEEEVMFENKNASITLAGTFTYPKEGNNFPAVVLVTGSGPQNRNEEVFGHKPFLVWSDYLTRNGIAVLRFDDRGTGKSTGTYNGSTTADFVTDAIAAVEYLKNRKEIDKEKIGIVGHSEGGVIAPVAANKCKDISFIVLGAGTAVPGDEIISLQLESISRVEGVPESEIKKEKEINDKTFNFIRTSRDSSEAAEKIDELYEDYYASLPDSEKNRPENSYQNMEQKKNSFLSPWMRYFLKYDPRTELEILKIPVLALFGEKDIQVSPAQNKDEMEKTLKKSESRGYKVVVLPGLNHVFQECKTGAISEYGKIEQTTSPKMLAAMTDWIKEVTK